MIFRFKHERRGSHVHVAVFAASTLDTTFAKMGDLVLRAEEWPHFRVLLVPLGGGDDPGDRGDGTIDIEASLIDLNPTPDPLP